MDITFCEKEEKNYKLVEDNIVEDNEEHIEDDKPVEDIVKKTNDNFYMGDYERKEMTKKVKLLSLNKMGKSIFTNTFNMREYERKELQKIMHSYEDISVKDIIEEFNNMMQDKVFDNPNVDISRLPVYDI